MSSSPISDLSSLPSSDHNLQPFFVLHKASASASASATRESEPKSPPSKKAKRRIGLSASPSKSFKYSEDSLPDDLNDPFYERLRFEAFNHTWSEIDSTIKDVLRKLNLSMYENVHSWVRESFSTVRASTMVSAAEIPRSYPLTTDALSKQIPTALICTKNAEFVDDLLTFQELGEHLKSSGCHVANLSALDFSAKRGIEGCLRSLLRILVPEAQDWADIAVLASWYSEPTNHANAVVVIIDDVERSNGLVLSEFIMMLSEWAIKVPVILIMGVTTSVDALRRLLPSDAMQHLQPCKFTLGSPCQRMSAVIEALLVKPCSRFTIGYNVATFLRDYFHKHEGTITSFIRALKLACLKHFLMEPLSFLGYDVPDEDQQTTWLQKYEALPDAIYQHVCCLPSCERRLISKGPLLWQKGSRGVGCILVNVLKELRRLQKHWIGVVQCIFEVGKLNGMQLLEIFCEAANPASYTSKVSDQTSLVLSSSDNFPSEGKFCPVAGGFITQAIYKVRELPVASLLRLLDTWRVYTEELTVIHDKVGQLKSIIGSADCGKILKDNWSDIHKSSVLNARKNILSPSDKAAVMLENIIRDFMIPIECIAVHEIVCFKHVNVLQLALIGDPRRTIQVDLMRSLSYLQCSCCCRDDNVLSSSMHDTAIMYKLGQQHGDLINLHDWYQSFKMALLSSQTKGKRKEKSPQSKKSKVLQSYYRASNSRSSSNAEQEKTRLHTEGCIWDLNL